VVPSLAFSTRAAASNPFCAISTAGAVETVSFPKESFFVRCWFSQFFIPLTINFSNQQKQAIKEFMFAKDTFVSLPTGTREIVDIPACCSFSEGHHA
jgi:hypothetical protein